MMTQEQGILTPTKNMNASKFNINHGHFITNLESLESPTKKKDNANISGNGGNGNSNYSPGKYSTSRVIESLHGKIDDLTNTNLKMTTQCHHLVKELESSSEARKKHLETISRLQTENVNLKAMLDRKSNRLSELEASLKQESTSNSDLLKKNQELEETIKSLQKENEKLTEQSTMYKVQYDAVADSHKTYKDYFTNEISSLQHNLALLERSMTKQVESKVNEVYEIDNKIQQKLKSLESSTETFQRHATEEIEANIKKLDLESWEHSLQEAQQLLKKYKAQAQAEGVNLQDKPQMAPLRNNKRKTSAQKRTSFYGTPTGFSAVSNIQSPPSSSAKQLPGLKRASSIRVPSDNNKK